MPEILQDTAQNVNSAIVSDGINGILLHYDDLRSPMTGAPYLCCLLGSWTDSNHLQVGSLAL